jgi:precorrin-6B C5,15-methyltransferase / cobalt-precorrin-6B C5,C15-methyltransferase
MFKIFVIGIADPQLSGQQEQLVRRCSVIVGTPRYAQLVAGFSAGFQPITPLTAALATVRTALQRGNVAILASGDPLFYGIGRRLLADFPSENLLFFPALSSIQRACALFHIPWDDARITSLHGRTVLHLPGLVLQHAKHLLLSDAGNSPDTIARQLLEYFALIGVTDLAAEIRMLVAEDIGLAGERIFRGTLTEASVRRFSSLNIICLVIPGIPAPPLYRFGLSENDLHHSRGLITKNEVRAATLHQLRLPDHGVLWDVGAGSGSLSIEAARANPGLTIFAIEQKEEELRNIKKNIVKFRCYNIVPVAGRAPEIFAGLPDPERVFIGGSNGALPAIIPAVATRLAVDGLLVINGVASQTVINAPGLMQTQGFTVHTSKVAVTRTDPTGETLTFNPITIMTGSR